MLRTALVLMLALAPLALPAAAADPVPEGACEVVGCPGPVVGADDQRACVGVGFSTGGTAVCYVFDGDCVQRHFGFAYSETCLGDLGVVVDPRVALP